MSVANIDVFSMRGTRIVWFGMTLLLALLTQPCIGAEPLDKAAGKGTVSKMEDAKAEALRLNQQAMQFAQQGRLTEAIPLARRSLELSEQIHGKVHPNVSADLITLAELYRLQRDYFNAEPLIVRAIEIDKQLYGPQNPEIGVDMGSLAALYRIKGDAKAAVKTYREAFAILYAGPTISTKYFENIANMHLNYGQVLFDLKEYEQAMSEYRNAVEIFKIRNPERAVSTLIKMAEIDREHGNQRRANDWLDLARQLQGQ